MIQTDITPKYSAKLFGVSDGYFMALQTDIDIRNAKRELAEQISQIKSLAYA